MPAMRPRLLRRRRGRNRQRPQPPAPRRPRTAPARRRQTPRSRRAPHRHPHLRPSRDHSLRTWPRPSSTAREPSCARRASGTARRSSSSPTHSDRSRPACETAGRRRARSTVMSRSTARVRHTPDDDPLTLLASAIDAKIEEWPIERLSHYQARWVWPPTFRNGPEWQPFVEDIRASGIREPLIVLPDGQVVDGGHRLEAARDVPLENAPVRVLSLTLPLSDSDRFALENWAVMDTLARRQLNRHETRGLIIDIEHAMAELQRSEVTVPTYRRGRITKLAALLGMSGT